MCVFVAMDYTQWRLHIDCTTKWQNVKPDHNIMQLNTTLQDNANASIVYFVYECTDRLVHCIQYNLFGFIFAVAQKSGMKMTLLMRWLIYLWMEISFIHTYICTSLPQNKKPFGMTKATIRNVPVIVDLLLQYKQIQNS